MLGARSVSEYSELTCFDHYLLWFCAKLATTCQPTNDFSDRLLGVSSLGGRLIPQSKQPPVGQAKIS